MRNAALGPAICLALVSAVAVVQGPAVAAVSVDVSPARLTVVGTAYRLQFERCTGNLSTELRDAGGRWHRVTSSESGLDFALVDAHGVRTTAGARSDLRHAVGADRVVVGVTSVLGAERPAVVRVDCVCVAEGVLVRSSFVGDGVGPETIAWAMPRMHLAEPLFDAYAFWRAGDELRSGSIASLGDRDGYAGVSPWGQKGDTAAALSERHPAVIAVADRAGVALGVVFLRYGADWGQSHSFIQRHVPSALFFYPAIVKAPAAARGSWAWLAPFPARDAAAWGARVELLLRLGDSLTERFESIAPEPGPETLKAVADFPAFLRRARPVEDIRDATVYTVQEPIDSDYGLMAARKVGSDVVIRGWFKWNNADDYGRLARVVAPVHDLGALFGGGITCSALYDGENGLTESQVRDMATRGPDGRLVDAWGERGIRHGTLSNPAYLEYLLSWCRRQIDGGADYLFMDEINAALQADEGFDDYSLRDFRDFLVRTFCTGKGWAAGDDRWQSTFQIDLGDPAVCPDGTIGAFDYRAWLKKHGHIEKPDSERNPLSAPWHAFRRERDDRAWKGLTGAIRAYAAGQGRRVLLSANGLAPYVDLQVLGVWDAWCTRQGGIDLEESQLDEWASTVRAGWARAGRRVPVVLFHDWGFGGFPWMKVSPAERELWMRVRGAEIYAAGGFFAFPVHGPFDNDALCDGTIREVARQTAFYQQNRAFYHDADLAGFEPLQTSEPLLGLAVWTRARPPAVLLHVINRRARDARPVRRRDVAVRIPLAETPKAVRIVSPDWAGQREGKARADGGAVTVTLPELEAYAVAVLDYDVLPALRLAAPRIVPVSQWDRAERSEFVVQKGGTVREAWGLHAFLHGRLHGHLANPPTFLLNMPEGGALRVHVRAVAMRGACLECLVDQAVVKTVDLPDLDGKNDAAAREYDKTYEVPIPAGRHRVTIRNVGGDWVSLAWYAFSGRTEDWGE